MSMYIDNNGQLHDPNNGLTLTCPHCQVVTHLTLISAPVFSAISKHRPSQVGVVYRCDACNTPVFIKYPVKSYSAHKVELSSHYVELERSREKFDLTYLPEHSGLLFKEALQCFSAGAYNAFASLCRRTIQAMIKDIGDSGSTKIINHLTDIRGMGNIDKSSFSLITRILVEKDIFDDSLPTIDHRHAGILLEVMKDLLYQCYIRRGKFKQALLMRRFFADERSEASNVTPIKTAK